MWFLFRGRTAHNIAQLITQFVAAGFCVNFTSSLLHDSLCPFSPGFKTFKSYFRGSYLFFAVYKRFSKHARYRPKIRTHLHSNLTTDEVFISMEM